VTASVLRLDVLVNNAGIGTAEPGAGERVESADGHELRFAVNYLAPFVLTRLLEPLLVGSAPARIVNVASAGQAPIDFDDVMLERGYDGGRSRITAAGPGLGRMLLRCPSQERLFGCAYRSSLLVH
jgi:hypothetical protein